MIIEDDAAAESGLVQLVYTRTFCTPSSHIWSACRTFNRVSKYTTSPCYFQYVFILKITNYQALI